MSGIINSISGNFLLVATQVYSLSILYLSLQVVDLKTSQKLFEIPKQKTSLLSFSSCGNYLCTWEGYYTTPDNPKGFNNLEILRVGDGSTVKSFVQKRQDTWYAISLLVSCISHLLEGLS